MGYVVTFADWASAAFLASALVFAVIARPLARWLAKIFADQLSDAVDKRLRTMSIDELEAVRRYLKQLEVDKFRKMARELVEQQERASRDPDA